MYIYISISLYIYIYIYIGMQNKLTDDTSFMSRPLQYQINICIRRCVSRPI